MSEGVQDFLEAKGGVGVLVSLYDEERTYSEILERVNVTSSTLTERLDDADDYGLVDMRRTHRHGRRTDEYYLTELGYQIALRLSKEGVVSNYRKMMTLKEQVAEGTDAVIEAVANREVGISMHPDSDQKTGREQYQEIREAKGEGEVDSPDEAKHGPASDESDGSSESGDETEDVEQLDVWETIEKQSEGTEDDDSEDDNT